MTVVELSTRREWVPIVRCITCGNDRAATGAHTCQPDTPTAPDTTAREPLTTF